MKKGFAMLYAVLISSLLLSVGIAILDLSIKEVTLASAAKESQYAFYAADDGLECALYWDHYDPNASPTTTSSFATSSVSVANTGLMCNGQSAPLVGMPEITPGDDYIFATTTFTVAYEKFGGTPSAPTFGLVPDPNGPCAVVTVFKATSVTGSNIGVTATTIASRGYDTCNANNPYRTERGIQSSY